MACVVVALVGILLLRDPLANSWHLHQFGQRLRALPHPPNTASLRFESRFGLLAGNGNHCDYFVGELRTFAGSPEALRAVYQNLTIQNPVTGAVEAVQIAFPQSGGFPDAAVPDELDKLAAWNPPASTQPLYLVYVYRSYEPNNDCRCH